VADEPVGARGDELRSAFCVIGIPQLRPRWTRAQIATAIPTANSTAPIAPRTGLWTAHLPPRNTRTTRTTDKVVRPVSGIRRLLPLPSLTAKAEINQ
jgi:hypothetical protein